MITLPQFIELEADIVKTSRHGSRGTSYGETWYLYGLVRALRPAFVVEVGVRDGATSVWLAKALQDAGEGGLLTCVDLEHMKLAQSRALELQVDSHIQFMQGDSSDVAAKWSRGRCVDLLFIDGDHNILGVSADFNCWRKHMCEKAFIVAHDAFVFGSTPPYSVNEFFNEVAKVLPTHMVKTGDWGLAVTQLDRIPASS